MCHVYCAVDNKLENTKRTKVILDLKKLSVNAHVRKALTLTFPSG